MPMSCGALVSRWALRGGVVLGGLGAVSGLVIGLAVYPPTAWFAVIEVAIPATVVGTLLGAATGALACLVRRLGHDVLEPVGRNGDAPTV